MREAYAHALPSPTCFYLTVPHDYRRKGFRNLVGVHAPAVLVQQSAANAVECVGMSLHPFITLKEWL
jgi:hypothetical protein